MTALQTQPKSPPSRIQLRHRALRQCLHRNEIYFKTVAATALTIVSLTFGWQQMKIAERQSETAQKQSVLSDKQLALTEIQSRVAEANALPSFEIKISQIANAATGMADNNILTVDNNGGPVREFIARAIYLVEIDAAEKRTPYPKVQLRISVSDYYNTTMLTAANKGHLATMFGVDNNSALNKFSRALSTSAEGQNWLYANTEERTFLRIEYSDILNRRHEEYYQVAPVSGSRLISREAGRHRFEQAAERRVSLRDLTVESVSRDLAELMKAPPR